MMIQWPKESCQISHNWIYKQLNTLYYFILWSVLFLCLWSIDSLLMFLWSIYFQKLLYKYPPSATFLSPPLISILTCCPVTKKIWLLLSISYDAACQKICTWSLYTTTSQSAFQHSSSFLASLSPLLGEHLIITTALICLM